MKESKVFNKIPESFKLIENDVDYKLAALTLTQAFADYRYPIPSAYISHSAYMKLYYWLSCMWLDNGLRKGHVLTNEDYSAVMIIVPIDGSCPVPEDAAKARLTELGYPEAGRNMADILAFIGKTKEDLFPANAVYIEILAVQTARQGQKLCSRLMRSLFEECDREQRDVVLFTNTEKNIAIYQHFGFEILKTGKSEELNSLICFMIRKAKKQA